MCKFPSLSLRLFPTREGRQGAGPGWPRLGTEEASIRPGFARSVQTSRLGKIYHRPDPPLIGWPADTGPMAGEKSARARHLNRMVVSAIPRLSRCVTKLWQDLSWERSAGDPRVRARPGWARTSGWPGLSRIKTAADCRLCCTHPKINQMSCCMVKRATKLLALNRAGIVLPRVCVPVCSAVASPAQPRLSSSCDQ